VKQTVADLGYQMTPSHLPLISIVTPSYNQRHYIEQMLNSVRQQDYPHIEHIVIDGGSTDGTIEMLKEAEPHLTWLSEPDSGQAAALNKGFALAKGEIFSWLNCDDLYTPGAIRAVAEYFMTHQEVMLLYGDALAIDARNSSYGLRVNVKPCDYDALVQRGDFIVQPAAFWRTSLWHQLGPLNETLHYALDYEYWMRAARRYKLHYVPLCLAHERLHEGAKTSKGHLKRINELYTVAKQYGGVGVPLYFRGEAAAVHTWQALHDLRKARWRDVYQHLGVSLQLRPPLLKFLIYILTMLFFGRESIAVLRLWANRLRSWRKPFYPTEVDTNLNISTKAIIQERA
jgi:glycosyltransferase involved in cell wall biosynthesis